MKVYRNVGLSLLAIALAIVLGLLVSGQAIAADNSSDSDSGNTDSNWTKEDVSDINNGVKDVNENLKDTKSSVDQVNKNLTDSNVDTSNLSNTIGGIKIEPVGIVSSAITAIVKLPTLLTNRQSCQPLNLGDLLGYHIQADCVSSQVNQKLWNTAGLISDFLVAFAIFHVIVKITASMYLAKEDPVGIAGGDK